MLIKSIKHRGLKRLFVDNDRRDFSPQIAASLKAKMDYIKAAQSIDAILKPPKWGAHFLKQARSNTVSIIITRNFRLTFRVDPDTQELLDFDYEDYH